MIPNRQVMFHVTKKHGDDMVIDSSEEPKKNTAKTEESPEQVQE